MGSVLGSFLYARYGASMYVVALLLLGLCIVVVELDFKERDVLAHHKSLVLLKRHVQEGLAELRHKPHLKHLMICALVSGVGAFYFCYHPSMPNLGGS